MCVNARALLMSALGEGEKAEKDRPVVKYGNQESHVPATTTAKFGWVAAPPSDVTSQAGHQAASSYLRCPTLLSKYYYGQHISTQQRNKQTKFIIITTQGISHKLHSSFFSSSPAAVEKIAAGQTHMSHPSEETRCLKARNSTPGGD